MSTWGPPARLPAPREAVSKGAKGHAGEQEEWRADIDTRRWDRKTSWRAPGTRPGHWQAAPWTLRPIGQTRGAPLELKQKHRGDFHQKPCPHPQGRTGKAAGTRSASDRGARPDGSRAEPCFAPACPLVPSYLWGSTSLCLEAALQSPSQHRRAGPWSPDTQLSTRPPSVSVPFSKNHQPNRKLAAFSTFRVWRLTISKWPLIHLWKLRPLVRWELCTGLISVLRTHGLLLCPVACHRPRLAMLPTGTRQRQTWLRGKGGGSFTNGDTGFSKRVAPRRGGGGVEFSPKASGASQ